MKNLYYFKTRPLIHYFFQALVVLFFSSNALLAQKVAVVGIDHSSPAVNGGDYDGISFVATETLIGGTVFYFTNGLYDAPNTRFRSLSVADDGIKFVIKYTVPPGGVAKGVVVYIQETNQTSNTLATTCSSGSCGTAAFLSYNGAASNFSIGSIVMGVWAYSDGDDSPINGITTIHSVLYEGYYDSNMGIQYVGNLPANMDPIGNFPNAIITDGIFSILPAVTFNVVEFKPTLRGGAVSKLNLEDANNYDKFLVGSTTLSLTAFANLNLVASNPTVSVTVSQSSVAENGATNMIFTFVVSAPSTSARTINFNVSGTAQFNNDYTASGSSTFTLNAGSVIIPANILSAVVTLDPVADAILEANETVTLTVTGGAAYDAGSPSAAASTIVNDDVDLAQPKIALVGINHGSTGTDIESFSFVALEDIPQNTLLYFTSNTYDKTLLKFINDGSAVVKWTAPAGVNRGDVYVITEDAAGSSFVVTCSSGEANCGTAILQTGAGLSFALDGTNLKAYSDGDADPFATGAGQIHSVLYTGVGGIPGGVMSATVNPSSIYPNAVIIENFPAASPLRTEYKFAAGERGVSVTRSLFTNTANWVHAGSLQTVSNIRFTNITITTGVTLPLVVLNVTPSTVVENGGPSMVYTFTASQNATADLTVNFSITGLAALTTDYIVSSSPASGFTFGGSGGVGTIKILAGTNTATITNTPVADVILEPNETIVLTTNAGAGYDVGSPGVATGTIVNDDVLNAGPLVAIIGVNAGTTANPNPDGFSFVANQDIPANTEIYFTTNPFSNTTLSFVPNFYVAKYTSGGLIKGQVVYVVETGPTTNAFTVTCSSGSNCGTLTLIAGDFSFPSGGVRFFAYTDGDTNPANGVTAVQSMFYTYPGTVPAGENPNTVYPNSVVLDGFNVATPDRTEYKFASGERSGPVIISNIKNIANYLIGQTTQNLSVIPFTNIDLCPASISAQPTNAIVTINANTQFSIIATGTNLTYQWQVNTGSGFVNIPNGGVYSGVITPTLVLTSVPCTFINYTYRCVVNDCAISQSRSLTVNAPVIPITTNNGLKFDGVNDYVIARNCTTPIINGGNAITVEYWFKGTSLQSAVRSQDTDNDYMVAGWNGKHILSNDGGTGGGVSVGAAATDGNWHHVAFTWQQGATNGFKSYLDGVLVEQKNAANIPLPVISDPLYLGAFMGVSEFMNGTLDEVRVWSIVRSQSQIQAGMSNFCNQFGLPQTGLQVYFKFDHGVADGSNAAINYLINAASTTQFTGQLQNFALTGINSNFIGGSIQSVEWIGNADGNWNNIANWACNQMPNQNSTVTIAAGRANYPTVNVSGNIYKLILNPGATIRVPSPNALIITGK